MTPQERLTHLLEVAAIPSNRGRLTHSRASAEPSLGHTVADQVYAAIKAVSEPTSIRYAAGEGIDTASATWKAQATHVAGTNEALAPHLVTLRDFESVYQPRWVTEGYEAEPTLAQVESRMAVDAITQKVNAAMVAASAAYDAGSTATEINAAAEAAWDGS